jgi:hypothetical protein
LEDSHEGVGESNFGSVYCAIAGCFDESKIIRILRIENDVVNGILPSVNNGELC